MCALCVCEFNLAGMKHKPTKKRNKNNDTRVKVRVRVQIILG